MINPRLGYYFLGGASAILVALILSLNSPLAVAASPNRSAYFDFGPYYGQSVLGYTFSSFENLPELQIPDNIIPAPAAGILPGSPFYPLERLWENTQVAFTPDPVNREELWLKIAAERLAEAKTLTSQGKSEAASEALGDFSQAMTTVAQNLATLAEQNNPAVSTLANKVEEAAAAQAVFTQSVSLASPPAQAESWTQATNAINQALDEAAKTQGEPAIPGALSTSLQELKKDGLISEEESNKLYSLKNRSEVREELEKLASSGQFPLAELAQLDTAVAEKYPEVQQQIEANLQVAELKSYQTLPQPSDDIRSEMEKWKKDPTVSPSNDIKPYLWYNRASELAKDVDLSNFPSQQQQEVAKLYPQAVAENSTYTAPAPSPSPSPSPASPASQRGEPTGGPSPSPTTTSQQQTGTQDEPTDQNVSPTAVPTETAPVPSPTPPQATPYLGGAGGALPGEPTYIFKQATELFQFNTTFDPAEKAKLKMGFAERRLAESNALASDPKKASLYESALKNYQQTMNEASSLLKNAPDSKAKHAAAKQLESQAGRHEAVLEKGLLPPTKDPQLLSEVIKATENAMDRSADALDRPALPLLLSQRLGDLKAQGLILPEEADGLTRSSSREEVRSKVRELTEIGTFPPADAKKLDEAQNLASPSDYNQLVEVRKVEELQKLRAAQTDFAQTPTLKTTAATLAQRETTLLNTIEPGFIKPEDLAGREDLKKTYQELLDKAGERPINSGQFGADVRVGATPSVTPAPTGTAPTRSDAVLETCPVGATFKQSAGCVWAESGKKLNDYDQYKCDGPRQYYSFAARKCLSYDPNTGFKDDSQPVCPVNYTWNWQTQSCQAFTGGGSPLPTPKPEPPPTDDKETEERSKTCPEGSSYKVPDGCVWDTSGKKVYDHEQYRCGGRGQYYSFAQFKCVPAPKTGQEYPEDARPDCKEENSTWSWTEGKCVKWLNVPFPTEAKDIPMPHVSFVAPGNPFYFLKQAVEVVQVSVAFSPEAKQNVRLAQANERLAEGFYALEKNNNEGFKNALVSYTSRMQAVFNDVSKSSLSPEAKKAIGENLSKQAVEQNLLLQKAQAVAESSLDTPISAAVSATILGVDKAADLDGGPPIPPDVKAKIEALAEKMMPEAEKKKILEAGSRVEARLSLNTLVTNGALTAQDTSFLNEDFASVDQGAQVKLEELKKLEEITTITKQKEETNQKIEKNEAIVQQLAEFEKNFEPGKDIPKEVRPYVRLTRIAEVTQTIRPDMVRLEDFQNRKDVVLAVATLQEEFRPTTEGLKRVEDFRRRNPNAQLPFELLRIESLSQSLGVRGQAGPCFLPTPPFPANTPCPAAGAAIPITSYWSSSSFYASPPNTGASATNEPPSLDKDGKPLVYGSGPKPTGAGNCQEGYHWMYDSGGWCMSNSGNYSSTAGSYSPTSSGYTPYSSYYTAPGAPPATYGYQGPGNYTIYNTSTSSSPYSAPYYYGTAPTNYTTTPLPGTVPGSGPAPTSSGQCPSGYHWMAPSGYQPGWCMADGPTYVPSSYSGLVPGSSTSDTPPPGGYNCGSQPYDPVTKKCRDGACPGGFNWDGSKCAVASPNLDRGSCGPGYYWSNNACFPNNPQPYGSSYPTTSSPGSSYQYGCTPGYYWDGSKCVAGNYSGGGWSDTAARTQSWCQPPSGGCGSNSYWDYGSCYCRSSSTYSSVPSPSNQCQGLSCGGGAWLDYLTCSCRYSGGTGTSSTGSPITCYPPSQGCPGGWYDYGTCSCKTSSSTYTGGGGSTGSCTYRTCSGSNEWFDWSSCSCRGSSTTSGGTSGGSTGTSSCAGSRPCYNGEWFDFSICNCRASGSSSGSSGSTTTSTSGSTGGSSGSTGSCPSGYHWMDNSWCMADGGGSTSPSPAPTTSTTTTTSEPAPQPATQPTTAPVESQPVQQTQPQTTTQTTTTTTDPSQACASAGGSWDGSTCRMPGT